MKIFASKAYATLAHQIASIGDFPLGKVNHGVFADGEMCPQLVGIRPKETVVIVQSTPPPAENWLVLYLMLNAARQAGAGKIIALLPYLGYSRQARVYEKGEPHSSRLMAQLIQAAGAHVCVTCEVHDKSIDQLFHIPVYNLNTASLFIPHLEKCPLHNPLFVAPDQGAISLTQQYVSHFKAPMISLVKSRNQVGQIVELRLNHSVQGKDIVLVDDLLATGATLFKAARLLYQNGAHSIRIVCTHALFSATTHAHLCQVPGVKEIIITNTIEHYTLQPPFTVLSIAPLFSKALKKMDISSYKARTTPG